MFACVQCGHAHGDPSRDVCVCLQSFNLSFNSLCSFTISIWLTNSCTQPHKYTHADTHSSYFNAAEGEALSSTAGGFPASHGSTENIHCCSRYHRTHMETHTLADIHTCLHMQYVHTCKHRENTHTITVKCSIHADWCVIQGTCTIAGSQQKVKVVQIP